MIMPNTDARVYQSHDPDTRGMSDSMKKLNRLKIPGDLSGKAVLDIGCNEGFFCRVAKERGAERVVGIDFDRARLNEAIKRYASLGIDFRYQRWDTLPEGKFDCVLWTSAMHYERDPKKVIANVRTALNDDGLLVLECGVIEGDLPEMRYVVRHSDVCAYPTRTYLMNEILAGFAVREVSPPELTEGDPVHRAVFHCRAAKPEVVIVRGPTGVGKSTFVYRNFREPASKIIRLDHFISELCRSKYSHSDFLKFVQANYDPNNLRKLYEAMDSGSFTEKYIGLLADLLSPSDKLTVIEGFLTERQFEALKRRVSGKFHMWELNPLSPNPVSRQPAAKPAADTADAKSTPT